MFGIYHVIVIIFGILGLLLGGVFIDVAHIGTLECKWQKFWGSSECSLVHGWLHGKLVMLCMIIFSLCFGFGMSMHYIMDFIK